MSSTETDKIERFESEIMDENMPSENPILENSIENNSVPHEREIQELSGNVVSNKEVGSDKIPQSKKNENSSEENGDIPTEKLVIHDTVLAMPQEKNTLQCNSQAVLNNEGKTCDNNTEVSILTESKVLKEHDSTSFKIEPEVLQQGMNKLNITEETMQPKSEVIVRKQSESLRQILGYNSDSSSDDERFKEMDKITEVSWKKGKKTKINISSDSSDSESDSSTATSISSESDSETDSASVIITDDTFRNGNATDHTSTGAVKKTHQAGYDPNEFLSPVPDLSQLSIDTEKEEFLHIGYVKVIISEIVTIDAVPGSPAFDIDTLLFIDNENGGKKILGPIFDVLGPVSEPMYCVRFNTAEEVNSFSLKGGTKIYVAPKNDCTTKFVFLKELLKLKGSDASWLNDQEEPVEMGDYSDDEKEREAKRVNKQGQLKRKFDDSLERHKRYEKTMNQCNILNTRVSKLRDAHHNVTQQIRPCRRDSNAAQFFPSFNPSIPPPGFGRPANYHFPSYTAPPPVFSQSQVFSQLPTLPVVGSMTDQWRWNDLNMSARPPYPEEQRDLNNSL